ncbi:hypothetical protein AB0I27_31605 [Streptomyces sp. NPDC050597]|uniref:hypothetical protein n=1 Tax=Streptomyces sp. NPDC050597 TaxID=3157212 RepID=UPI003444E5FD
MTRTKKILATFALVLGIAAAAASPALADNPMPVAPLDNPMPVAPLENPMP